MALSKIDPNSFDVNSIGQYGGRRNLAINGAMQVAQRGSTTGVSNTSGYYACDRWRFSEGGFQTQTFTMSQSTDAPDGFGNSFKIDVTTAASPSSDHYGILEQRIEGQNLQGLKYGTSDAKDLTVSFWVKSPKTGAHVCGLFDLDNLRLVGKPYTVSSANTWEYHTITFSGDTGGSGFDNDNARSLDLRFYLYVGSDYTSSQQEDWGAYSASALGGGHNVNIADSTDNNFYLTGVQLEVGSVATPFEHRSYGEELSLCQRYYYQIGTGEATYTPVGVGNTEETFSNLVTFYPVKMRAIPSLTYTGLQVFDASVNTNVTSTRSFYAGLQTANMQLFHGALTRGRGVYCNLTGSSSYAAFDAEL